MSTALQQLKKIDNKKELHRQFFFFEDKVN